MVWYDETPEYEALSYVWGPTSPAERTVLNGKGDLEEKAHQIKLMRPIYALASGVLVLLGSGTVGTDAAMRSIEKFDKAIWSTYNFQVNFVELLPQRAAWTFVPTMSYILKHEADGFALLGLMWQTRHFKTPIPSWVPDFTISADSEDEHNPVFLRGSCMNVALS
ncbi:hypothetical protein EPUS_07271 [Endocarpon pusillum Z07020]|uniref:Uncharacterized protein n=1 Tax=Endocarpon pusillum (strain Z07020 / HMAS-L-300199) TaxID=1263415 RepID=U1GCM8_ENDPU|nr:uncharacterized protein EPUS_07271 [Endocarpon pusillum Z07020]ERF69456.1 hypothetical protein EPUS_07271 [Endocarpon pusillum Z07020]